MATSSQAHVHHPFENGQRKSSAGACSALAHVVQSLGPVEMTSSKFIGADYETIFRLWTVVHRLGPSTEQASALCTSTMTVNHYDGFKSTEARPPIRKH
ncbi:hypothetical protein GB937_004355 [Aspergillus fischeri]|nr:hypothetical protein GB937_004355 [Aspergillus fischeri]